MSRFKNETGSVLTVNDLGIRVGPGEKFEWPDHDPEVHGLPTGCAWLDAPDTPRSGDRSAVPSPADPESPAEGAESDADGPGDSPPGDDTKPKGKSRSAAGREHTT